MKILSRDQTNLTPIFIIANTGLLAFLVLLSIIMFGKMSIIVNTKPPTLVELSDGTSVTVGPIGHTDRAPRAISDFVGRTMVNLLSWNALPKPTDNDAIDPTKKPILDSGVQAGDRKVTTGTWAASFALSEDFRASFLQGLAQMTPQDVFNGKTQSALIVRHLSPPQQQGYSRWTLDLVANLVIFPNGDRLGKAVSFNKTIFVRAVDTPSLPVGATDLQQATYLARKAGLEIYKIQDMGLGR